MFNGKALFNGLPPGPYVEFESDRYTQEATFTSVYTDN